MTDTVVVSSVDKVTVLQSSTSLLSVVVTGPAGPAGPAGPTSFFSAVLPLVQGTAAAGVSTYGSREDHVHPSPALSAVPPLMDASALAGSSSIAAREDHVHPIDTSRVAVGTVTAIAQGGTGVATAPLAVVALGLQTTGNADSVVPARLAAARTAVPTAGLMGFNTSINQFEGYNGTLWGPLAIGGDAFLAVAQSFTKAQRGAPVALTDAASIATDLALGNNFSVTLGGNRTLANPTNVVAGQSGSIVITQDATGSRTLAYGGYWKFAAGTAPSLTTTANAVDVLVYYVESATRITAKLIGDVK